MTDLYVGLDVSLELTNVCVVDGDGRPVHEARVGSDPETIAAELKRIGVGFVRVGLEAGPLSQWMFFGLKEAGLPAVCIEATTSRPPDPWQGQTAGATRAPPRTSPRSGRPPTRRRRCAA